MPSFPASNQGRCPGKCFYKKCFRAAFAGLLKGSYCRRLSFLIHFQESSSVYPQVAVRMLLARSILLFTGAAVSALAHGAIVSSKINCITAVGPESVAHVKTVTLASTLTVHLDGCTTTSYVPATITARRKTRTETRTTCVTVTKTENTVTDTYTSTSTATGKICGGIAHVLTAKLMSLTKYDRNRVKHYYSHDD